MTSRARLFAVLNGDPTDHVPVWLLFPYHPLGCYVDVQNLPGYREIFEASKRYAIMLNRRSAGVPLHDSTVSRKTVPVESAPTGTRRETISWRGRELVRVSWPDGVQDYLQCDDDLEFFCSLPVNTDATVMETQLQTHLAQLKQGKEEFPEEYGAMMLSLGEPIGALYQAANLEELAIWSLTHNDLVVAWLDRVMEQKRHLYRYFLEHDAADVYFLVGSELAAPPLMSRTTFQRWIVPYARELTDLIHSYEKKVIQHFHGQIGEILPDFLDMHADALHTIEAPPIGNCTHTQAFDVVGDDLVLIGNIQYDDMCSLSDEKMRQTVLNVLDECHGKRHILSPTAGPFDPSPGQQLFRNYQIMMETAWQYD